MRFSSSKTASHITRRSLMTGALGTVASNAFVSSAFAAQSPGFARWVEAFHARATRHGISDAVYNRVMRHLTPDTSVYEQVHKQPEFTEQMWQYVNRRCSEWRVNTGKERARENAALLARVERDYGV
ncbi:MAG TPA: lytic murein transglycosylase, partial [Pseudolabrys sp.]